MATITVRNLDEELKRQLRVRAAENGRSMEEEARDILRTALGGESSLQPRKGLGTRIHERFKSLGGVELELPPREPVREPPDFERDGNE